MKNIDPHVPENKINASWKKMVFLNVSEEHLLDLWAINRVNTKTWFSGYV